MTCRGTALIVVLGLITTLVILATSFFSLASERRGLAEHEGRRQRTALFVDEVQDDITRLILEEAAYCDPNFFYETLAPILLIDRTSLLAISTLTSEINFYSRLMKLRDSETGRPIFTILQIQLSCQKCIEVTLFCCVSLGSC